MPWSRSAPVWLAPLTQTGLEDLVYVTEGGEVMCLLITPSLLASPVLLVNKFKALLHLGNQLFNSALESRMTEAKKFT